MFVCLYCGLEGKTDSAKFCASCGKNWKAEEIDTPTALKHYTELFTKIFFDRAEEESEKLLLPVRERGKISHLTHQRLSEILTTKKLEVNNFSQFNIEFDQNVTDSYAGNDTYLRFRFKNNSSNDLLKFSLNWRDSDVDNGCDLSIRTDYVNHGSDKISGGSCIFPRIGVKEISDLKIVVTNKFNEECTFVLSPISFRVLNPNQKISQNFSTHNQISIEGRGVIDASGGDYSKLISELSPSFEPRWIPLTYTYVPSFDLLDMLSTKAEIDTAIEEESTDQTSEEENSFDPNDIQQIINAAQKGNSNALHLLGRAYYFGRNLEKNYVRAFDSFMKSATLGNPKSPNNIGVMYRDGKGVTQDYSLAIEWFTKAIENNSPNAPCNLGNLFLDDANPHKNYELGVSWLKKSAAQEHRQALRALGQCYLDGKGIQENPIEAKKCFEKAIELGNKKALVDLAKLYLSGRGAIKDTKIAAQNFLEAGYENIPEAQYNLALLYKNGDGVPQDFKLAIDWATKSAKEDDAPSCELLGDIFSNKLFDEANNDVAISWYEKAVQLGCDPSNQKLNRLRDEISAQEKIENTSTSYEDVHKNDITNWSFNGEKAAVTYVLKTDEDLSHSSKDKGSIKENLKQEDLYAQAYEIVFKNKDLSYSFVQLIQRELGIGFDKASKLIEEIERAGYVSAADAAGKRNVYVKLCFFCGDKNRPDDLFCRSCNSSINDGIFLVDGSTWYGELDEEGVPTGYGTYLFSSGEKYEGYLYEGLQNGEGVFIYTDGQRYEGNFLNGNRHGKGKFTYANGSTYDGEWNTDAKHGKGVETYGDGAAYNVVYFEGKSMS
jgi:TPR repeat protein